jgi:hypothetical protein
MAPSDFEEFLADDIQTQIQHSGIYDTFEDTQAYFDALGVKGENSFDLRKIQEEVLKILQRYTDNDTILTVLLNAVDWDYLQKILGALYVEYCGVGFDDAI